MPNGTGGFHWLPGEQLSALMNICSETLSGRHVPRHLHVTGKHVLLKGKGETSEPRATAEAEKSLSFPNVGPCAHGRRGSVPAQPTSTTSPLPALREGRTQTDAVPESRVTKGARRAITHLHIPSTLFFRAVVTKKCTMCHNTCFRGSGFHLVPQA